MKRRTAKKRRARVQRMWRRVYVKGRGYHQNATLQVQVAAFMARLDAEVQR